LEQTKFITLATIFLKDSAGSVAYNFRTGNNILKLLTEYESVTQKALFGIAVLAALMFERKHDIISKNGDCPGEAGDVRTLVFRNKVHFKTATSLHISE
jgi:hypothetical protein